MPTFARRSGPLLIVTTFAIACAGAKTTRPATSPTPAQVTVDRMIVRTAVQVVSVDSIEGTAREVERIVAGVGGFVERANIEDMKASLQCRVPAARLEQLMDRVSELGGEKRRS